MCGKNFYILRSRNNAKRAIETARLISNETSRGYCLKNIAKAFVQRNQLDRAIETLQFNQEDVGRGYSLINIASAFAEQGQLDRAIQILLRTPGQLHNWGWKKISNSLINTYSLDKIDQLINNSEESDEIKTKLHSYIAKIVDDRKRSSRCDIL